MKTNIVQIVIMGVFMLALIAGVIVFAMSSGKNSSTAVATAVIWGTIPKDTMANVINILNNNKPGTIDLIYKEFPKDTFEQSLVEAIADGEGPDAVLISNDINLKNKKRILPIGFDSFSEREFKDTFVEGSEVLLSKDGIYGIPLLVDPLVMYWNRDRLTTKNIARPPQTWEEVLSLVDVLTERREDRSIVKSAIAFGDYSNVVNAKDIIVALTLQSGGQIVVQDNDGKYVNQLQSNFGYEVAPFSNAVSFFTEFSDPLKPIYSWNRSLPNSLQAFLNGDLAFYFGRASEFASIKSKNPNLNFDVAVIPQPKDTPLKKTTGTVFAFSLLNSSKNLAEAFRVANFLTSSDVAALFSDNLNLPSARRDLLSQVQTTASKSVFAESAIILKTWLDPNPLLTDSIFKNGIDVIVTGKIKTEEAVILMSQQFSELLNSLSQ